MRLVSMSHHARLKHREPGLYAYVRELNALFLRIKAQAPLWTDPIMYPSHASGRRLAIIIGSQKGLCGNFNTVLFKFIDHELARTRRGTLDVITIGKRATDYAKESEMGAIVSALPAIKPTTLGDCARVIADYVITSSLNYESVQFFSNDPKSFFAQIPRAYTLVPFLSEEEKAQDDFSLLMQDYSWQQPAHEIVSDMVYQCFRATVHHLLFRSLLAEQAARFLSMDGATRNAKNLLETTRLHYNKVRQAKITREIIELSESV